MLAFVLVGCGAASSEALSGFGAAPPDPQCETASDCSAGLECHGELRICTVQKAPTRSIALVAEPQPESALAPSHQGVVQLDPANPVVDVVLPRTVRLTGRVRVMGNALDASVEASLFAIAEEEVIPGEVRATQANVTNDFALVLQAGVSYTLTIAAPAPDGGRPNYATTIQYSEDADMTFWLPALSSLPSLRGRVVRAVGNGTAPIADVRVSAAAENGGGACTTATTGKLGDFLIRCPQTGNYAIAVRGTEDGPVVPSFHARLLYGTSRVDAWPVEDGENTLTDIEVPGSATEANVSVQVFFGGAALQSTSVTAGTTWPDSDTFRDATLRVTALTDRTGTARLRVLEATYDLHAIPTTEEAGASGVKASVSVRGDASQTMTLEPRPIATGVVVDSAGTPVPDARVAFRAIVADPGTGGTVAREFVGQSDEAGAYAVPIDRGTYELQVEPLSESGLPSHVQRGLEVGESGLGVDVALAPALVLEGTVYGPGSTPVERVDVHALDIRDGVVTALGRGRTDAYGRYFIILPAN